MSRAVRRAVYAAQAAIPTTLGGITTSSVTATWKAVPRALSYKVEYRPASGGAAWVTAYTGTALTTSITGLTTTTTYEVRVTAAVNGASTNPQTLKVTTA